MSRAFQKTLYEVCRKKYGGKMEAEQERVHQESTRDKTHAFRNVDIPKPNPWRGRTGPHI